MRVEEQDIPPYLETYLRQADELPERLPELSHDECAHLQGVIRTLVVLAACREGQRNTLQRSLDEVRELIADARKRLDEPRVPV